MRAAMCLVLVMAIGCKKEAPDPAADDAPSGAKPAPKKSREGENATAESLPAATAKSRLNSYDAYAHYRDEQRRESPKKHEFEGKRVVFRLGASDPFGAMTGGGKHLVVEGSGGLFRRPQTVYLLRSGNGWKKGEMSFSLYIEGVLRGATDFKSLPWSKEWIQLTPQSSMPEHFVLIDDAIIVTAPGQ